MNLVSKYNTMTFNNIYKQYTPFKNDYIASGMCVDGFKVHYGEEKETVNGVTTYYPDNLQILFILLYARYGNTPISNADVNQFKFKMWSIIFEFGPTWQKELEIQKRLRELTEDELVIGAKTIYNKAFHDATAPSTNTLDEIEFINEQNTSNYKKSKMGAYADLMTLIKSDVTNSFLAKFRILFKTIISFEFGPRIESDIEEEDLL